jgi:hypothetical protein
MGIPSLEIPIRFKIGSVPAQLKTVGDAGKHAGDETAAGFTRAGKAVDGTTDSVGALMRVQAGLAGFKAAAGAISASFRETANSILASAKEFQALRKSMQEVATLKGQGNTGKFTLGEARKAQGFNLTPEEFRNFQAEFQNYAGSQIGGPEGKLTEAQGEDYAGRVAELMKGSGINPAVGAELAGSLLENTKGPQDVDKLMQRLGTTFQVLEKGRVPLSRALPQMSEIMGMGVPAEEAAQMFSIVSPASPGQEGIAVQAALRAIQEMKTKGTGEEFGVKKGMSQFDSVKAFAENINARKQKMVAGGMTDQKAEDELAALLAERGVAADVRERRGLVSGFGRQGVELGGFKRYGEIAAGTPLDFEAQRKKRYEDSEQGQQDKIDAAQAVEDAAMGERNVELLKQRQIAKVQLTKEGAFEKVPFSDRMAGMMPLTEPEKEQQINRRALSNLRGELGEKSGTVDALNSQTNQATNQQMKELLERIEKNTAAAVKAPPLTVPIAQPTGAPRGGS